MSQTLATPTASAVFPEGTVDTTWVFALSGTNADGSAFADATASTTPTATFNLPPGVFTLVVTKNGVSSLASDPFTVAAPVTVTLTVPDAGQKATIT